MLFRHGKVEGLGIVPVLVAAGGLRWVGEADRVIVGLI